MDRLPILVSTLLVLTLVAKQGTAQAPTEPAYFIEVCRSAYGNYTMNSTYHKNLQRVFSDLKHRALSSPFDTVSRGEGLNRVYGHYYCRGDIEIGLCVQCIGEAAESLLTNCSRSKAAIMWFQECTLRYENQSMAGIEVEYPRSWWSSDQNVSDPNRFSRVLQETVDGLIENSTGSNSSVRFATMEEGIALPTSNTTLYCLVQCSPDLNATQCDTCLRSAFGFMPTCCGNSSAWMFVFYPVCQVRYSTLRPFYALPPL